MKLHEDLQQIIKHIPDLLNAYEKFVLAGVDFQKLCNEDDFKDYLYTKQDYENKKPVSQLFLAAINTPETFRKETEHFIREVIKASGLEQTDPKITGGFKKLVDSWKQLLTELKKIPDNLKSELITHLQSIDKSENKSNSADSDFSLVEEFEIYTKLWD